MTTGIGIVTAIYVGVMILGAWFGLWLINDHTSDEEDKKYGARAVLLSFVWPIAFPIVFFVWLFQTAFPRKDNQ